MHLCCFSTKGNSKKVIREIENDFYFLGFKIQGFDRELESSDKTLKICGSTRRILRNLTLTFTTKYK